ncbi:hypothetical protein J6590_082741 [Homalodisca vitripennis]|nr:hypothetical protein J6590_082741 [Homalodisca vitripennis]
MSVYKFSAIFTLSKPSLSKMEQSHTGRHCQDYKYSETSHCCLNYECLSSSALYLHYPSPRYQKWNNLTQGGIAKTINTRKRPTVPLTSVSYNFSAIFTLSKPSLSKMEQSHTGRHCQDYKYSETTHCPLTSVSYNFSAIFTLSKPSLSQMEQYNTTLYLHYPSPRYQRWNNLTQGDIAKTINTRRRATVPSTMSVYKFSAIFTLSKPSLSKMEQSHTGRHCQDYKYSETSHCCLNYECLSSSALYLHYPSPRYQKWNNLTQGGIAKTINTRKRPTVPLTSVSYNFSAIFTLSKPSLSKMEQSHTGRHCQDYKYSETTHCSLN